MTREQRLDLLKQIEQDIYRLGSSLSNEAKACALRSTIEELEQEPCEDAISRQAVLALAKEECDTAIIPYRKFVKDVNALLPVTPQPKTGHWIRIDKDKLKCSECDITHFIAQYPNGKIDFCPNCGAKMESEDKE